MQRYRGLLGDDFDAGGANGLQFAVIRTRWRNISAVVLWPELREIWPTPVDKALVLWPF